MAISVANAANGSGNNTSSPSLSITTPAANALLVATIACDTVGSDPGSGATGFTQIQELFQSADLDYVDFSYKIATGAETSIGWTGLGASADYSAAMVEITGCDATSPLEASGEDESAASGSGTSTTSGSATAVSANGIAVAAFGAYSGASWASRAYTNSFTEAGTPEAAATTSFNPIAALSYLVYSSSGSKTTTLSTTSGGGNVYGAIAVFKEAAGGGTTVNATKESLTLTDNPASFTQEITPTTESLSLTDLAATVALGREVVSTLEGLALTDYAATVQKDATGTQTINAVLESLILTDIGATVSLSGTKAISALLESLTLTDYPASITAVAPSVPRETSGAGGRYYGAWAPQSDIKPAPVRKYRKTREDEELERLLKLAIEDEIRTERLIRQLDDNVNAVSDIHRASQSVEAEIQRLMQTHQLSEQKAREKLRKLKEEEDLILALLLMEVA